MKETLNGKLRTWPSARAGAEGHTGQGRRAWPHGEVGEAFSKSAAVEAGSARLAGGTSHARSRGSAPERVCDRDAGSQPEREDAVPPQPAARGRAVRTPR